MIRIICVLRTVMRTLIPGFGMLTALASSPIRAQQAPPSVSSPGGEKLRVPRPIPVPVPKVGGIPRTDAPEPSTPPPQNFVDPRLHLYFHLGPGWNLARKDGEMSTFHLDARSAPPKAQLRAVASLAFNPYPLSTFSGAFFYLSSITRSSPSACTAQAHGGVEKPLNSLNVANVPFLRGLDEHGHICTESRNVTYTAMHQGSCLRFDLTVNTFCGGDVTGAQDLTDQQLASVFRRLESILDTVQFLRK